MRKIYGLHDFVQNSYKSFQITWSICQKLFPNGTLYEFSGVKLRFQIQFDKIFREIDSKPCVNGFYTGLGKCKWISGVPFTHVSGIFRETIVNVNLTSFCAILDNFLAFSSYSVLLENIIDKHRLDQKWIFHTPQLKSFRPRPSASVLNDFNFGVCKIHFRSRLCLSIVYCWH